jgi:hypothetical protein
MHIKPTNNDNTQSNDFTYECNNGASSHALQTNELSRGPFLTSPLGANFDPRSEVVPQVLILSLGVKFSVRPSILLNIRECSPLGVNKRVKIPPRGQISTLGAKGEVKNGPLFHYSNVLLIQYKDEKRIFNDRNKF